MSERESMWKKVVPRAGWTCAGLLFVGIAVPRQAHAQFGIDLGVILAGLQKISGLLMCRGL